MIILAGGSSDHNINRILDAVQAREYDHMMIHTDRPANLCGIFNAEAPCINGVDLSKGKHSLFIRYDIFGAAGNDLAENNLDAANMALQNALTDAQRSKIASAWYDAIKGWAMAADNVTLINQASQSQDVNKIRNIQWAREAGFKVPTTHVTNDIAPFAQNAHQWIAKPVCGGAYTTCLSNLFDQASDRILGQTPSQAEHQTPNQTPDQTKDQTQDPTNSQIQNQTKPHPAHATKGGKGNHPARTNAPFPHAQHIPSAHSKAMPWIIQEKLAYPECRLYQVGDWQFAFAINNTLLDSRDRDGQMSITHVSVPPKLAAPMRALSKRLGLDYTAADFKTCPQTGDLKFLETNTMPMITGYDTAAGGELSDALALRLRKLQR